MVPWNHTYFYSPFLAIKCAKIRTERDDEPNQAYQQLKKFFKLKDVPNMRIPK